uniref:Uncharacterized protein n=1 Tax=Ralstonia phage BOESR1 TaxID=3034917 RepID=A0AA50F3H4_9CAUD|nr:hypothetical protein HIBIKMCM_00031 [Ralstonia phage BOESR1]
MGRTYEITFEEDLDVLGECGTIDCHIAIKENQNPVEEADTVLHEVLHAVHFLMDIGLSPKLEEQVVRKMATGLMQVFADNPQLLMYLANAAEPPRRR